MHVAVAMVYWTKNLNIVLSRLFQEPEFCYHVSERVAGLSACLSVWKGGRLRSSLFRSGVMYSIMLLWGTNKMVILTIDVLFSFL